MTDQTNARPRRHRQDRPSGGDPLDQARPAGARRLPHSRVPFDWQRPDTWPPRWTGSAPSNISYFPDIAAPGAADARR